MKTAAIFVLIITVLPLYLIIYIAINVNKTSISGNEVLEYTEVTLITSTVFSKLSDTPKHGNTNKTMTTKLSNAQTRETGNLTSYLDSVEIQSSSTMQQENDDNMTAAMDMLTTEVPDTTDLEMSLFTNKLATTTNPNKSTTQLVEERKMETTTIISSTGTTKAQPIANYFSRLDWYPDYPNFKCTDLIITPLKKIYIRQTNLSNCNKGNCIMILKSLAESSRDKYYNFIIGGDGAIYEGKGWKCVAENKYSFWRPKTNELVIGLTGYENSPDNKITTEQKNGLINFLNECSQLGTLKKFDENYNLISFHDTNTKCSCKGQDAQSDLCFPCVLKTT
ncbi:uncharacterized protein LOC124369765 [Homalodisca vitripennis]|uniref:uncharacterized protein LOC124369765 n=1 Tax=Homalodisca vitripennis TaxID=197043 RepID=UPI001EECD57B|nr:uncharacterized protein LOC124369765 [Homalodisca vitripennis]